MEYPSLITEWTSNMGKDAYEKQAKIKIKPSGEKSIVTLVETTSQRALKNSFCGSYFRIFLVLRPIICQKIMIFRYCN